MKAILLLVFSACTVALTAQVNDSLRIEEVSKNYILGFYISEPSLLEESLHPKLIKRTLKNHTYKESLITKTKADMIALAKVFNNGGKYSKESKAKIKILDIHKNMATVKLTAVAWTDYLQ